MKNFRIFHLKTFIFLGGKIFSIFNRLVLVMGTSISIFFFFFFFLDFFRESLGLRDNESRLYCVSNWYKFQSRSACSFLSTFNIFDFCCS